MRKRFNRFDLILLFLVFFVEITFIIINKIAESIQTTLKMVVIRRTWFFLMSSDVWWSWCLVEWMVGWLVSYLHPIELNRKEKLAAILYSLKPVYSLLTKYKQNKNWQPDFFVFVFFHHHHHHQKKLHFVLFDDNITSCNLSPPELHPNPPSLSLQLFTEEYSIEIFVLWLIIYIQSLSEYI